MVALKIQHPPFPNRKKFPFVATVRYRGMLIDIENLDGSVREGTDPNGKKWQTPFKGCHYGELRGSKGTDGDLLDVYIKSNPRKDATMAYVVHQNFPRTHPTKGGQYDEDKVILGVASAEEAKELYLKHYNRKDFFRSITEIPLEAFKRYATGENKGEKVAGAKEIGEEIGIDWSKVKFPVEQLAKGMKVEKEHGSERGKSTDVGGGKNTTAARIAWAHLKEFPDYYTRLDKMETEGEKKMGHEAYYKMGFELALKAAAQNPYPYNNPKAQHGQKQMTQEQYKNLGKPKQLPLKKNLTASFSGK